MFESNHWSKKSDRVGSKPYSGFSQTCGLGPTLPNLGFNIHRAFQFHVSFRRVRCARCLEASIPPSRKVPMPRVPSTAATSKKNSQPGLLLLLCERPPDTYAATRRRHVERVQSNERKREVAICVRTLQATCGATRKKMMSLQSGQWPPPRQPAWIDARPCKETATQPQRGCEGDGRPWKR